MAMFDLFDVTPIGIALVITGIFYFVIAGRYVLPVIESSAAKGANTMEYFEQTYGVGYVVNEVVVPANSPLVGESLDNIEPQNRVRIVGIEKGDGLRFGASGVDRSIGIAAGSILAVLATPESFNTFAEANKLQVRKDLKTFAESLVPSKAGIAELVVPPNSSLIDKSARDLWLRKSYGISLLAIHRGGKTITREGDPYYLARPGPPGERSKLCGDHYRVPPRRITPAQSTIRPNFFFNRAVFSIVYRLTAFRGFVCRCSGYGYLRCTLHGRGVSIRQLEIGVFVS